jgi:hydrogenase maturation protease
VRPRRLTSITTDPYTQPAVAIPWPTTGEGPARDAPALHGSARRRVLVGGVGYRNLRDMSVGPELIERLRRTAWPSGVEIEDLSYGAVHVLHWLQEHPPFDAVVLIAAVARGRPPGAVTRLAWTPPQMTGEAVQGAIAEAVTGVISLDTLLTVLAYFAALPPRVVVIEVEPRDDDWGPEFSPLVRAALDEAVRLVESEVQALVT